MRVEVNIKLVGELPDDCLGKKNKELIKKHLMNGAGEVFGEYEIWGELFGNDDNVYALFLDDVDIKESWPKTNNQQY